MMSKHLAILDKSEIVGDLVIKRSRLRVARLRQPVDPAGARRLGFPIDFFDQRASQSAAARAFCDEQVFQIAVSIASPGRAMEQIVRESRQFALEIGPQRKYRLIGIMKPLP